MRTKLAAIAVAASAALVAAPAFAGVPTTDLDPATLGRGADVAIPHLEGKTFVDGDLRVPLGGRYAWLLGASGGGHLVAVNAMSTAVRRIDAAGNVSTVVKTPTAASVHLSENGRRIVVTGVTGGKAQPRTIYSATTGEPLRRRTFSGYPTTLGMTGAKVLLSDWKRGTYWWASGSGRLTTVSKRPAGYADLGNDLFASYTADPYQGGCTVLSRISRPGRTIWRSCKERVESISPDERLIATVDILSDGIGPATSSCARGPAPGWPTTGPVSGSARSHGRTTTRSCSTPTRR
ncbi:hypothetical protein [Nocardioides sp. LHG3406-4]|uniref:hypothetical protein n=1 Tax=Nocardioides sp. LHG3406-4 TaxID=2804575 RepID=UPI003CF7C274